MNSLQKRCSWWQAAGIGTLISVIATFWVTSYVLSVTLPTEPRDLLEVQILDQCQDTDGNSWFLLEPEDGQRGYITHYRGKPGDRFRMWAEDIHGYKLPPSPDDLTSPQIELGLQKDEK